MTQQHIDLLNMHDEKFTDCLDLLELLGCLRNGVLHSRDVETIKAAELIYLQRRRLLQILKKKPDVCFYRFIDALHRTKQPHLASLIEPKGENEVYLNLLILLIVVAVLFIMII